MRINCLKVIDMWDKKNFNSEERKKDFKSIIKYYASIINYTDLGLLTININSNLVSAPDRKELYWTSNPNVTLPNDKWIMFRDILEEVPFRELKPFMFGYWGEQRRIDRCSTINRDKAFTITTSKTHPSQYYLNEDRTMMRNLTITEFERLQTLPDGYTSGVKETSRYKGVGNGWTVDVIAHIFKGLSVQ